MNDSMEQRLQESYEELRGLFLELYPGDIAALDAETRELDEQLRAWILAIPNLPGPNRTTALRLTDRSTAEPGTALSPCAFKDGRRE